MIYRSQHDETSGWMQCNIRQTKAIHRSVYQQGILLEIQVRLI